MCEKKKKNKECRGRCAAFLIKRLYSLTLYPLGENDGVKDGAAVYRAGQRQR